MQSDEVALTQREREVLALIGDGLKNRQIADRLLRTPAIVQNPQTIAPSVDSR